jgi:protein-disulfide isomerase
MLETLAATAAVLVLAVPSQRESACDGLAPEQRASVEALLASEHPYACCNASIAACLLAKPASRLATRLAEDVCRRVVADQERDAIHRDLARRAASMRPAATEPAIDLRAVPVVGDPQAPVTVVEYACGRCPFCKNITPRLHAAIVSGPLKGKVRLYFKVFPNRAHAGAKEAGLAFLAATELGRGWEFILHAFAHFDEFAPSEQARWAQAVGIDPVAFSDAVADPKLLERLLASKKEGIVLGVDTTPSFFIDGRKYEGNLAAAEIIDVLEEEFEAKTGQLCQPRD